MTLEECYNRLHGNYTEAKSRLMSDRLVDKFVLKFLDDITMQLLNESVASGDRDTAFRAAHTLKGVAGNLSFTELQNTASELTEQLRDGTQMPNMDLYAKVKESYSVVVDAIQAYQAEK